MVVGRYEAPEVNAVRGESGRFWLGVFFDRLLDVCVVVRVVVRVVGVCVLGICICPGVSRFRFPVRLGVNVRLCVSRFVGVLGVSLYL